MSNGIPYDSKAGAARQALQRVVGIAHEEGLLLLYSSVLAKVVDNAALFDGDNDVGSQL